MSPSWPRRLRPKSRKTGGRAPAVDGERITPSIPREFERFPRGNTLVHGEGAAVSSILLYACHARPVNAYPHGTLSRRAFSAPSLVTPSRGLLSGARGSRLQP